ncbi:MAG: DUF1700 domain-containing protein [Clostridiales bacterium]|nr:DUF1700 domain-containing protein [Clostridiales bacterium]
MNKKEYLAQIKARLKKYPKKDVEERLAFYGETIDDRIEEGLLQANAVEAMGSVDEIVAQIVAEMPSVKSSGKVDKSWRKLRTWEIVLLVLGSPIWLSLIISAFAIVFSIYVSVWAVLITLWAVELALGASAIAGVLGSLFYFCVGRSLPAGVVLGVGIVCAGLAIFAFFVCKAVTKGMVVFTKKFSLWLTYCFRRKEGA